MGVSLGLAVLGGGWRTGEVVEAFALEGDGGDGDGGLEAEGCGYGGDEGAEEGMGEVGCV